MGHISLVSPAYYLLSTKLSCNIVLYTKYQLFCDTNDFDFQKIYLTDLSNHLLVMMCIYFDVKARNPNLISVVCRSNMSKLHSL